MPCIAEELRVAKLCPFRCTSMLSDKSIFGSPRTAQYSFPALVTSRGRGSVNLAGKWGLVSLRMQIIANLSSILWGLCAVGTRKLGG